MRAHADTITKTTAGTAKRIFGRDRLTCAPPCAESRSEASRWSATKQPSSARPTDGHTDRTTVCEFDRVASSGLGPSRGLGTFTVQPSRSREMSVALQSRRALIVMLAAIATAIAVFAAADRADAAKTTKCQNAFRVLHDDHVGKLQLRAGNYQISVTNENKLSCQRASELFTKFLQDYDGKLSNGWTVNVKKSGFEKTRQKSFYVKRTGGAGSGGGSGGRHPGRGEMICPGTFQV